MEDMALPYITNTTVIDPRPHYTTGSHDVLTGIDGVARKRPGTGKQPGGAAQLPGDIKRIFFWVYSNTTTWIVLSVVGPTDSFVYAYHSGVSYTLIHTCSSNQEPFDFVGTFDRLYFSNGTDNKKWDGTTVTDWGITAPGNAPSGSVTGSGNVPNHIGHSWCYAYGVSSTGYVSDISPLFDAVPADGEDKTWDITGDKCADTQCDKVHVYRTEDGGATLYELPNSPIANPGGATWTITDNYVDEDLSFTFPAPLRGVNSPPPLMFQPTFFAGRIWGFFGDRVYYSTNEENNTSIPEQCFGTTLTNSFKFARNVTGLGVAGDYLIVFTGHGIYKIGGDTLVTFYRSTLSHNLGTRARQNIGNYESDLVWLDSSYTLRITDGDTIGDPDLSLPIRPDLAGINDTNSFVGVHSDGKRLWILLLDSDNGLLYVFDVDKKQWMVPWTMPDVTCLASSSAYNSTELFLAWDGYTVILQDSRTSDEIGGTFDSELRLGLFPINKDNPTGVSQLSYIAVERNQQPLQDVSILVDDKPELAAYTSLFEFEEEPNHRTNGQYLVEKRYHNEIAAIGPGQRISPKLTWADVAEGDDGFVDVWELYSLDLAFRAVN